MGWFTLSWLHHNQNIIVYHLSILGSEKQDKKIRKKIAQAFVKQGKPVLFVSLYKRSSLFNGINVCFKFVDTVLSLKALE